MKTPTTIYYLSERGVVSTREFNFDMSEFEILIQAIKNTEDGFTYICPTNHNAEYKGIMVGCGKWIWSAKNENFFMGLKPSLWMRIQLQIVLFFNL